MIALEEMPARKTWPPPKKGGHFPFLHREGAYAHKLDNE
jgi:hypothetical protein